MKINERRVRPKDVINQGFLIRCSVCGAEIRGRMKKDVLAKADFEGWRFSEAEGIICGDCLSLREEEQKGGAL